jgi:hypothetical protein
MPDHIIANEKPPQKTIQVTDSRAYTYFLGHDITPAFILLYCCEILEEGIMHSAPCQRFGVCNLEMRRSISGIEEVTKRSMK